MGKAGPAFLSRERQFASSYEDDLFSRYLGDTPEDSDALYAAYRGLREAYSEGTAGKSTKTGVGRLFEPEPEERDGEGEGSGRGACFA